MTGSLAVFTLLFAIVGVAGTAHYIVKGAIEVWNAAIKRVAQKQVDALERQLECARHNEQEANAALERAPERWKKERTELLAEIARLTEELKKHQEYRRSAMVS